MKDINLNGRLFSASELVRQGAHFADIGTDHAYLPIFLLANGRVRSAVCADINEGPLESAKRNAEEYGITDGISFVLTDGAEALRDRGLSDIAICGMGGELIAAIIDRAPFLKNPDTHLILQPMTRQAHLRAYLYSHGFEIKREVYSYDAGRYYVTLLAVYTGECESPSAAELEIGPYTEGEEISEQRRGYLTAKASSLLRVINGKSASGDSCEVEKEIYEKILLLLGRADEGKE